VTALTPDRWRRIRAALDLVLEAPLAERARILDEACGEDPDLRAEVEALVEAESRAGPLLHVPVEEYADALAAELAQSRGAEPLAGTRMGAYRLIREIGRGGMGSVYLAERADGQFEHQVAVKVLRRGLDTDDVLRRFLTERQILASLDHPNVARLLDGGATDDGRPYLVMEHVEGQPIDRYCEERALGTEARVRLFVTIADAVLHAHRNLVVHRDLKPSNILVTDSGAVKLLDFGIAKLLHGDPGAGAADPVTRTGLRLLTPEYASPEQVRGGPVTTSSDVYQLGLLLYHLLTGDRAYSLRGRTAAEIERIVCEEEPPPPSALDRRLRGDLDAIVLKALRKEPADRYASVDSLVDDLLAWLDGRPVRARGDRPAYRLRKLLRRHRWSAAAAAAFVLLLAAYAATVSVQAERVRAALATAQLETATAQQVTEFLLGLFTASRPETARGEDVTARELLSAGVTQADELADQPIVQARLLGAIGRTYHRLGLLDEARPLYERAIALQEEHLGPAHEELATSLSDLAVLGREAGDPAAAEPLQRRALAMRRAVLGRDHPDVAISLDELGRLLQDQADYVAAEPLLREALEIRRRVLGADHNETASSLNSMGLVLWRQGRPDEAEPFLLEALAVNRARLGDDHPWVASIRSNLALVHIDRADWTTAESLLAEAIETDRRAYGDDHWLVALRLNHLATVRRGQGRYEEADELLGRAIAVGRRALGDAHPSLARFLVNHARVHLATGDAATAAAQATEALDIYRAAFQADHPWTGDAKAVLDEARARLGH
jgi:eukaryotic-like serine/threonine-protein kinase